MDIRLEILYLTLLFAAQGAVQAFRISQHTADQTALESDEAARHTSHARFKRVIGGKPATDHSFVVKLKIKARRSSKGCTGSLISRCHVLTATHCLTPRVRNGIKMTAGQHNTKDPKDGPKQDLGDWDKGTTLHRDQGDVAIMRLKKCVTVTKTVAPICLADEEPEDGCDVTVYGWGLTNPNKRNSSPCILQEATTKLTTDACNKISTAVLRSQICTARVTASGDSGGPMVVTTKDGKKCQVGVNTKVLAKPTTKFSLYTSTAHPAVLNHFIKKFVKENPCPCDSTVKFCKPNEPEKKETPPKSTKTPSSTTTPTSTTTTPTETTTTPSCTTTTPNKTTTPPPPKTSVNITDVSTTTNDLTSTAPTNETTTVPPPTTSVHRIDASPSSNDSTTLSFDMTESDMIYEDDVTTDSMDIMSGDTPMPPIYATGPTG